MDDTLVSINSHFSFWLEISKTNRNIRAAGSVGADGSKAANSIAASVIASTSILV